MRKARIIRDVLIVVMATAAATATAQHSKDGTNDTQVVSLYSSGSRALAMLTLRDGPPAPVVFDTGEDKSWLVTPYARRLKLKVIGKGPLVDEATGVRSTVPLIQLAQPRLGGAPVSRAVPTMMIDYDEPDMVGVFGPGAFRGRLVTLELSKGRVRIEPLTASNVPRTQASPYFHDLPAVTINVAGVPVVAHLDSGSTLGLGLGRGLMTKLKFKTRPALVGRARSVSGEQDIYSGQIDGDVKIGPLTLHDPVATFLGDGDRANVGYDIVRELTLVMDPAGQRSWVLDPADLSGSLEQFAGSFGERMVRVVDGKLQYQRKDRPPFDLKYLGGDLFDVPGTGDRIQFHRRDGRVVQLELITQDGLVATAERSG